MSSPPPQTWFNALLRLIQEAQLALLQLWHAMGWSGEIHGQPAWPWTRRIAGETLLIDLGLARQTAWSVCAIGFALGCVLVALCWRRRRVAWLGLGALALILAPWPSPALLLTAASPTSFHTSPTGFSVATIADGARVYAQHCAACHGADGRGEGPLSATLPHWPPTFMSPLLGRRAEGELFWHIVAGMRDAQGLITMPGFGHQISDSEAWAVIDHLRALAAGTGAAMQGSWPIPLRLPDVPVRCGNQPPRELADWRGNQRVRVVAVDSGATATTPAELPLEDPRFLTLLVTRDGRPPATTAPEMRQFRAECVAASRDAWQVFAQIAGIASAQLAGTAWLADRQGWLRARAPASGRGWSDADLLCTAGQSAAAPGQVPPPDGLTALVLRMDAEPVRFVQGGFIH